MYTFAIGQIVHHRRYQYRGVIVAADSGCTATEAWYTRNQTQPRRGQAWYHVLVDGGRETYVAEENLEPTTDARPVDHPLIKQFFPTYQGGRYYRECLN